ncbi:MAG: PspC domain-containing protein [Candidatus Izemoplasma sp.]
MDKTKRLYKVKENQAISGVCTGLAEYLKMDLNVVRILFAVSIFVLGPITVLIYIVMAIALPYGDDLIKNSETVNIKKQEDQYAYDEDDYKI